MRAVVCRRYGSPDVLEIAEAGKLSPAIGGRYPLGETPAAIRALVEGRARGKLVILP